MIKNKILEKSGSFDYDYSNDILFFKVNEREYSHSIELLDYVIDIDTEGFVSGLQIFNSSSYFNMTKDSLRDVKNWSLRASVKDGILEVKLVFNSVVRNKIVEKSPILIQKMEEQIPNSQVICEI
jgi:uncharacterized protein YuzE